MSKTARNKSSDFGSEKVSR